MADRTSLPYLHTAVTGAPPGPRGIHLGRRWSPSSVTEPSGRGEGDACALAWAGSPPGSRSLAPAFLLVTSVVSACCVSGTVLPEALVFCFPRGDQEEKPLVSVVRTALGWQDRLHAGWEVGTDL